MVKGELELIQLKNFSFEEKSKIEIKLVKYPKKYTNPLDEEREYRRNFID